MTNKEKSISKDEFVPNDFEVPPLLETDLFRLRMLSIDDVEKDYEAVIESRELLHTMFGGPWPRSDFTIEENLTDLERHQQEFLDHKAFAYTVISLDESRVLGCVYINPSKVTDLDAVVFIWVRQTEYEKGLDEVLFNAVRDWISTNWPFRKVDYPGRV